MKRWRRSFSLKWFLNGLFLLGTIFLLAFSLAGYGGELHPLLELTSHFKVQYLLLSLIPLFFFVLSRYKVGFILSLCCLLITLVEVAPWYFPQSAQSVHIDGQPIRVLFSNIDKYSAQYDQVIALTEAEKPDIAVFVEVGKAGVERLSKLRSRLPYVFAHQDVEIDGTAVYSAFPLLNPEVKSLGGGRKAIIAQVRINGKLVTLMAVHPSNAIGKEYVEERNRQLDAIAAEIELKNDPMILAGDFNTTPWSVFYRRSIGQSRLRNTRLGFGILPSWQMVYPFFAIPIDHVLVSQEIGVEKMRTGRSVGSDHLPVIVDLRVR